MSRNPLIICILFVIPVWVCAEAFAQIDYRVRSVNENREGRALDSNPQAGAGGLNQNQFTQQNYAFDYGLRASNIITGNVTGLSSFQGDSPILANNAFRVSLPSAGLASFRASTASLPEITSGRQSYGPGAYFDPQQIIPDVGAISRGLNSPGSSQLVSPYQPLPLPAQRALQTALNGYDPTDPSSRPNTPFSPGVRQTGPLGATTLEPLNLSPYSAATASSIFGTPSFQTPGLDTTASLQARLGVRTAPYNTLAPKSPADSQGRVWEAGTPTALMSPVDDLNARSPGDFPLQPQDPLAAAELSARERGVGPSNGSAAGGPLAGGAATGGVSSGAGDLTPGISQTPLAEGRFGELLAAMSSAQAAGAPQVGFLGRARLSSGGESAGGSADAAGETPGVPGATVNPAEEGLTRPSGQVSKVTPADVKRLASAVEWEQRPLDSPIESFVGMYQSQLNGYLKAAEDALKRGEYYTAAAQYDLANTVDPSDPLPLLGRGHALAAAGDYMSAVYAIERGIARFPQIAAFRIDLLTIAGRVDAYDIRRADLERRLEIHEDYRLRFLLGYLELYTGQAERGLRDLEAAAKAAPADGIIAKFPGLLTGRIELPPVTPSR